MKSIVFAIIAVLSSMSTKCQNPVNWVYSSKKIADKTYEVHITAIIQNGWHLYSQTQPKEAIAIPTSIKFTKHPLITFKENVKEIGKLEKHKEPALDIEQWQYSEKVEFVQVLVIKSNVKTNINGSIEFQACTNEKCLPAKVVEFSVGITY